MPKIRDLGISVLPATMRPAEIGGGAADFEYWAQKTGCPATDPKPAEPPGCPPPSRCQPTNNNPKPKQKTSAGALPDAAVGQLRQQLHDAINDQLNEELLN